MRTILTATLLAGTALGLGACSQGGENEADTTANMETPDAAPDMTAAPASANVLNANEATADELANAPGMTPELASTVVAGRPYASADAFNTTLLESLSQDEADRVLETVFVPVNLNSATREDIQRIPGMTDRMVGEFLEYRPYENMEEFDREIGKYVDEAEVARFRNYVTL